MKKLIYKTGIQFLVLVMLLNVGLVDLHAEASTASSRVLNSSKAQTAEPVHKSEILVKYKGIKDVSSVQSKLKEKLKLTKFNEKLYYKKSRVSVMEIGESDDLNKTISELKKDTNVEFVQPNYKLTVSSLPNDPRYKDEWGLNNSGQKSGKTGVDIGAEQAWKDTMEASSVLVGVLDTGIDINHPDLKNNIFINENEIPDNGIDDDGNGFIDDVNGFDFVNNDATLFDSSSSDKHGTEVAGVIAAEGNDVGIIGVAPQVKILPLKFINKGTGYTSDAIAAIEYAKQMGVSIINASFGGPDNNPALKDAIASSGILFVAAAGNDSNDLNTKPIYPAAYNLPNLLSVAAINNKGELASFSNFGNTVDVAAPGVDVLTTLPDGKYESVSGTSIAAPFVTGTAALVMSKYPDLSASDVAHRISSNVSKQSELAEKVLTNGWVNAEKALLGIETESPIKKDLVPVTSIESSTKDSMFVTLAASISKQLWEAIHFGEEGVSIASGGYGKTVNDMSVEAPGFTVNISRSYNSKDDKTTSGFGRGWTFGFEGSVRDDSTSPSTLKVVKLPTGGVQVFIKNSDGTYTANDSHSVLVKKSDGTHLLTTQDQYTYGFDYNGYLTWMQDRQGNRLNIVVNSSGKVTKITDTVGRIFNISYNAAGYITSITDPIGRVVRYEYDASNRLEKVYDTNGQLTASYVYDSQNYITAIKDGSGNTLESLEYDRSGGIDQNKVIKYTDTNHNVTKYTYDETNKSAAMKDLAGRTTTKWYDAAGYVIKSQDPDGLVTLVEYYNDESGYNKFGEEKSITDRYGNKTTYTRDVNGNITQIINPDNSTSNFVYDDKNNLISESDELGHYTYYVYDDNKVNLVKKAIPLNGTDVYSNEAYQTKFAITGYEYYSDAEAAKLGYRAKGLLKSETDPEGGVKSYTYDKFGNRLTENEYGHVTTNTYNDIGWKKSEKSPEGFVTTYVYDNIGRLIKTIGDNGETTFTEYDINGRPVQQVSPNLYKSSEDGTLDTTPTYIYKNNNVGIRTVYESNGLVSSVTDARGYVTSYTYDFYGNVLTETKPNGSIYTYQYDVMNRPKKKTFQEKLGSVAIPIESYTYSVLTGGRSQKVQTVYLNAKETAVTTWIYDDNEQEISKKQPDGTILTTEYYPNDLVKSKADAKGNKTIYAYNGQNLLSKMWTPFSSDKYKYTGYEYDRNGKLLKTKTGKDPVEPEVVPSDDRVIWDSTSYNSDGTVAKTESSSGEKTTFEYNEDGVVTRKAVAVGLEEEIVTQFENNDLGKPVKMIQQVRSGDLTGNSFDDNSITNIVTTYEYDLEGRNTVLTTPDGKTTESKYDEDGNVLAVTKTGIDDYGQPTVIINSTTYDWDDKPLTTTDGNGNVTKFEYDGRGNLIKQIDAMGGTEFFAYDYASRKIAAVLPNSYSNKPINKLSRTEYNYDSMGRIKFIKEIFNEQRINLSTFGWINVPKEVVTKAYLYDANGNVIKELDGEGILAGTGDTIDAKIKSGYGTIKTYNAANLPVTSLDAVGKERGLSWTQKFEYDAIGNLIKTTDAKGIINGTKYDDEGHIIAKTIRSSASAQERIIQSFLYDLSGREISETDGNGNVSTKSYNAYGQIRTQVEPGDETIDTYIQNNQYDVMGRLVESQFSDGLVQLYTYDELGNQRSKTEQRIDGSEANTESTSYDKNGNIRFVTDANGSTTEKIYDKLNQLVETKTEVTDLNGKKTTQSTTYGYDLNGNRTWEQDWIGNRSTTVYDERNRKIATVDANGVITEKLEYNSSDSQIASYDALNRITKFSFDKNNRQITTTNQEGDTDYQSYNNAGQLASKTDANGSTVRYSYNELGKISSVTNALGEVTSYTYDLNGNLLTQKDGNGHTLTYEYNVSDKEIKRIDDGGRIGQPGNYSYISARVESKTYLPNGQLMTSTDRNGNVTTYVYDIHDNLLTKTVTGTEVDVPENQRQIKYTYDNVGRQLTMTDGTGVTRQVYDELGRVIVKTVPGIGTTTFLHDVTTGYSTGFVADVITDPKGNITTKVLDKTDRLVQVKDGSAQPTTYEYYADGSQHYIYYPNGIKEEYIYFADKQLKILNNYKASALIDSYSYTYDAGNNQLTKNEVVNNSNKGTTTFQYDKLNRVRTIQEPDGKKTEYTYDHAGNRSQEKLTASGNLKVTSYKYDERNRLLSTTEVKTSGETQQYKYTYDNNGNMLTKTTEIRNLIDPLNPPDPSFGMVISGQENENPNISDIANGIAHYEYDVFNQLVKVTSGSGSATYTYNGDGQRVVKTANRITTSYLYNDDDKVVLELNETGQESARNLYGINLISRKTNGIIYSYLYNGHADVTALVQDNGTIAATYTYDVFGNLTSQTGTVNNSIRYAGYQYDDESGLYYLNARYYDPKIARFMSEDTYDGEQNDPLSLNLYTYGHNNPIRYTDPTGHWIVDAIFLAADIAAFAKKPSLANAGMVALSVASFADPTGAASAAIHGARAAGKVVKAVKTTKKAASATKKVTNVIKKVASAVKKKVTKKASTPKYMDRAMAGDNIGSMLRPLTKNNANCPVCTVSRSKHPEAAKHIEDAIKKGHPDTLTIDRNGAKENRKASLKGHKKVPGKDLDEYPPAMFKEGGHGASIRAISQPHNRGAGSSMGHQLRKYSNGTKIKIKIVD
ncbi:RHS repeat-associated protein [Paenibacillus sp. BK033]|uniref:S8 family serine peptidase n=1 Tax=Paenibacillus sp. BK033 TaxID=2512133 RepID=UPI00104CDB45|nr:S8 family serine peptidase [Paenibacillus sp. BK033]TCM99391.1 RHS repeat-associated protein [Paenibacillus sp. BK033]